MLSNPTLEKLKEMHLGGMHDAYSRQITVPDSVSLTFEERFSLIVDSEWTRRKGNRYGRLVRKAGFPVSACIEDINRHASRKLNRNTLDTILTSSWIESGINLILTGATGTGKTWLACAFADLACRREMNVRYYRVTKLLELLSVSKKDNTYLKYLSVLKRCDMLVLDDFGLNSFNTEESRILLDVIDDRNCKKSTIIVSQVPINTWPQILCDPTISDAIMDRIINNAYLLELDGPSMRKRIPPEPSRHEPTTDGPKDSAGIPE